MSAGHRGSSRHARHTATPIGRIKEGRREDQPRRPTPADLAAARSKRVRDVIDHDLDVLLVGINPGLYTAAIGHHFGRPGNRFWPALHQSGFTDRQLAPWEDRLVLACGLGITNLVARTTATAAELSDDELARGASSLRRKLRRYRPRVIAFLGLDAARRTLGNPKARIGLQPEALEASVVWVLPNPSGLNANHQLPDFVRFFRELRAWLARTDG